MNKLSVIIYILVQFTFSMLLTPSILKISKSDSDMTLTQSWPIAVVQMIFSIIGFVVIAYFGSETEKALSSD